MNLCFNILIQYSIENDELFASLLDTKYAQYSGLISMHSTLAFRVLKYVSMLLELLENNLDIDAGEHIPEDLESFVVCLLVADFVQ